MAAPVEFEAGLAYSQEVKIVSPSSSDVILKKIHATDLHGADFSVQQTKYFLLSEFNIENIQDYVLVLIKSDNSRTIMNDQNKTIDYIQDIASDSVIKIEIRH